MAEAKEAGFVISGALEEQGPKVSVYMPTKNRLESVLLAVSSVQRQTLSNFELIIVDDGSDERTCKEIAKAVAGDSRIIFLRNEKSAGACAARNRAIRLARGEFVTGLDDDDELHPGHLEGLVAYWSSLQRAEVEVSCLYVQYLQRLPSGLCESAKRSRVCSEDLFEANFVGNQIFAPRQRFIDAGLFDEQMPAWQDLEFFYRVLQLFGPARLFDAPTYHFDLMPRDDRISSLQKEKILKAYALMFMKHGEGSVVRRQKLLLQVYSPYYGFSLNPNDFWRFLDRRGSVKMLVKLALLLRERRRASA
ncbi:MAG: hypothetical protein CFE46_17820 [Burkholderiales bacterium PBB6]|nr:MAG: hypothetical protein CFE46_17820 [Burkholderiales bacterium PBB6]